MSINLKFSRAIIFLLLAIPLTTASQINYNRTGIPMFELNNTPLIETIEGAYMDSNNYLRSGKIVDYDDANVNFNYSFSDSSGVPINNKEVDVLNFNITYKIKNNVKYIVPFSFILGEWPQLLTIIDHGINVEIKNINAGNSSLVIYGRNKSIFFPKLPPSFEYVLSKQNESTILSIVGRNVSKEGRLEIELKVTEFTPLELLRVNSFKEYSVISLENGKMRIQTDFYKDFDYLVSSMIYFDDPEKTEKPSSEESVLSFQFGVFPVRNWNDNSIANDSEKLLLIMPFPNKVISEPIEAIPFQSGDLFGFMFNPLKVQRLDIKNYENRVEILDLDRYIFPLSYFENPEITYLPNKTILYWNYSQIETPLAVIGFLNKTPSQKLVSSGNQILIVKPESKKYISKEIFYINPPVNETEPPSTAEIIRSDNRFPLKPKLPIPLSLDTSSDAYIQYIKVDGSNLIGPWELKPNLSLDEGKYYSIKTSKNKIAILFTTNTSNPINVELKYTRNAIENIEKVNSYTWKYSIYEFYPIGDIPDYKQIYKILLPSQYSFSDFPADASHERTQDGDQIILEYNQSVRFRYINFSISSEALKKMAEEEKLSYKAKSFVFYVLEQFNIWILGGIFTVIVIIIVNKFNLLRKIKDKIDEIKR
ncbi:MAG: hypothetical protein WA102_02410 [Candidatus Methanoperedens sp.]